MAASMVTSAFSSGFDMLYPLRVVAIVIALYYFRKSYTGLGWQMDLASTGNRDRGIHNMDITGTEY